MMFVKLYFRTSGIYQRSLVSVDPSGFSLRTKWMPCIEKKPIYDMYCIIRRQYQRCLNILFWDVSVAQLVASIAGVALGGVVEVVGSNLARGKLFTAYIYIYIYNVKIPPTTSTRRWYTI